ncbi:hypothetical protein AeMF1_009529 [Aphanomyces euteiches]|nr:hypothetical protein AeMF1_009529 [Aphanomyces euteiches]KAH9185585.1 hypothetical protein AeNC1_012439 [Aphanomyces euteiches]
MRLFAFLALAAAAAMALNQDSPVMNKKVRMASRADNLRMLSGRRGSSSNQQGHPLPLPPDQRRQGHQSSSRQQPHPLPLPPRQGSPQRRQGGYQPFQGPSYPLPRPPQYYGNQRQDSMRIHDYPPASP